MRLQELLNPKTKAELHYEELLAECPEGEDPINYAEMIIAMESMNGTGSIEEFMMLTEEEYGHL